MPEKNIKSLLQALDSPVIAFKHKRFFLANESAILVLNSFTTPSFIDTFFEDYGLDNMSFPHVVKKNLFDIEGNVFEFELTITTYGADGQYHLVAFKQTKSPNDESKQVVNVDLIKKKLGLFRVFINQIKEGVLIFTAEGRLLFKNSAAIKLTRESNTNMAPFAWEIFKYFKSSIQWRELSEKKDFQFTEKIRNKYLLIDFQKRNFEGDDYLMLLCNDITENYNDKIALEEKNTQIDFIENNFPVAIFEFHVLKNKIHYFNYVSPSFKKLFGFSILTHYKFWLTRLRIHPEDISSFLEATQQSILYNEPFKFTGRMILKDNSIKWFEANAVPEYKNKKIIFNGIIWDVSQQKVADFEIKKRREFNDSVLFNIPADVAVFDKNHNYLFINPNGISDPELRNWLIGKNDFDYCLKKGIDNTMAHKREEYFQEAMKTGRQVEWIDEIVRDNRTYYVMRRFYPFYVEGEFAYMIGYGIDISDIKNLQNLLSKTEKQNNLILQSSMEGIVIIDEDCTISFWNSKAEKIFGWSAKETIGKNLPNLIFPKENGCFEINDFFKKIEKTGHVNETLDLPAIKKDGKTFPIELNLITVNDQDYKFKYFVYIRDITSRKEKEDKIQMQNEILKRQNTELEQFNYIASHDLQEPLLTIIGYSELLQEEFNEKLNDEGKLFLNFINNSANRMRFLISGLLEYNRINKNSELKTLNLNQIINDVTEDLSALIKESNATIISETLPTIQCYPIFIRLLFQNLISNALKFRKENIDPVININTQETDEYWEFEVKDNGIGIEELYFEKIFQIFRRLHTSEEYSGYGIGLAHCKKIVDIHNGDIWIQSDVNQGTSFFFSISKNINNDTKNNYIN
jgi:PAS domain S-box-containing protein